jgi:hypothetical protein
MKIRFLFLSLCLNVGYSFSQLEFSRWYFGSNAGLTFTTTPPVPVFDNSLPPGQGSAIVCDNAANLLFYSDGALVKNSSHLTMANGSGLNGEGGSTQSSLIVKQPGSSNIYYLFTVPQSGNLQKPACYSVIDMNLAAGLGSVTVKNFTLYGPTTEKQAAVRHCNGKDVWVVSHEMNSVNFHAYRVTSAGVSVSPVISPVGIVATTGAMAAGQMKISPDGKKLAIAINGGTANLQRGFYLFDFDAATGVVSNSLALPTITSTAGGYGLEFSPDGKKMYGTDNLHNLFQWDICASTPSAIISSVYTYSNSAYLNGMLRAIDGKIYVTCGNNYSLSVINSPNSSGVGMNISITAISTGTKMCGVGLPSFPVYDYTRPTPLPFNNTIACQSMSFAPVLPTSTLGCLATPYPPSGYLWDFGEPSSGASNTSTLSNPSHFYSSTGTYTVKLIQLNPCTNDTVTKVVTVSALGPTPSVSGNFEICKGEKRTYTVSGGSSYAWSSGGTASTTVLNPQQTTAYTASVTLNGCMATKGFTVDVLGCAGINALEGEGFRLFPNPVRDRLTIIAEEAFEINVYNLNGGLISRQNLIKGENTLATKELSAGVYIIEMNGWRGKIIKME